MSAELNNKIKIYEPGVHSFSDDCPVNLNLNSAKDLLFMGSILALGSVRLEHVTNLKARGLQIPFEAITAQSRIRDYIMKTGPEQTPLVEFQYPSVFDSNLYPPDTIVRIKSDIRNKASIFHYDSELVEQYCHRHKVQSSYPRGWIETDRPISPWPDNYIGIIRQLPGMLDHMLIFFENNPLKLISQNMRAKVRTDAIALGKEGHVNVIGKFFDKFGFKLGVIGSTEKVEILAMGKAAKSSKRIPAERQTSSPMLASPVPV